MDAMQWEDRSIFQSWFHPKGILYVMWRNLDIIIIDSYEKKDRFLLMIEIWKICQRLK